jgi:TolB-like protein
MDGSARQEIARLPLGIDPTAVRASLERVLASRTFTGADRLSRFLRFIVEQTLDGRGDELKEYLLGVEVFDRTDAFDPRLDTIVRVEARRLRARLADYYREEGAADAVSIGLPRGGYVPKFELQTAETEAVSLPGSADEAGEAPVQIDALSARLVPAAIVLLVIVAAALGLTWRSTPRPTGAPVTLAVLPLVNYSGDPRYDTLAARLTDGIITELARVPAVAVRSRTSVLQYKDARRPLREIARSLAVGVVMEGGVVAENGDVKVDVRLVSASADRKFWVETFVGRQKDMRALEQRIAQAAAAALAKQTAAAQ